MNSVYIPGRSEPLGPADLAREANAITKHKPFCWFDFIGPRSRLNGDHCSCCGNGEFVLFPVNDPVVVSGQKRYMQCRICGGISHL